MANRDISVGVKIDGSAKGFKSATEEARKATERLRKEAVAHSKEMERKFKDVTITVAKLGSAVLVAKEAFKLYAAAMNTTEGTADKLEEQMAFLQGTVQGVMQTIFSGDWGMLIENIKNTAQATRDYAIAMDELTQAQARNKISKGDLEFIVQSNRVLAAETTDPTAKKGYISAAIDAQRQLTAINKSEIQKRIDAELSYYKTVMGESDAYWQLLQSNIVSIAKNYDVLYANREYNQKRINDLNYLAVAQAKGLTAVQKEELRSLVEGEALLRDYLVLQDELSKKGQFEQLLNDLGALREENAKGEQEIARLTKQLTTEEKKIKDSTDAVNEYKAALDRLNTSYQAMNKDKNPGKYAQPTEPFSYGDSFKRFDNINRLAEAGTNYMQEYQTIALDLENIFTNLFSAGMEGWEEFGNVALQTIKRITAELLAKAAVWTLLNILTGGSFGAGMKLGDYLIGQAANVGSGGFASAGNKLETTLRGRDIYIAGSRYNNSLIKNT